MENDTIWWPKQAPTGCSSMQEKKLLTSICYINNRENTSRPGKNKLAMTQQHACASAHTHTLHTQTLLPSC